MKVHLVKITALDKNKLKLANYKFIWKASQKKICWVFLNFQPMSCYPLDRIFIFPDLHFNEFLFQWKREIPKIVVLFWIIQLDIALQYEGSVSTAVVSSHIVTAFLRCTEEWFQIHTLYLERDIMHTYVKTEYANIFKNSSGLSKMQCQLFINMHIFQCLHKII